MILDRFRLAAFVILILSQPASAQFIGSLDGVSAASTFEINSAANLPILGWSSVAGSAIIYDVNGGVNGSLHSLTRYGNYQVQHTTATNILASTRYTLTFDMGFATSLTGGVANYSFRLGTVNSSNVFTELAGKTGSVSYTGNMGSTSTVLTTSSLIFDTSTSVSGDRLAVRWAQTSTNNQSDFFGFDNVRLHAQAVPEPSSAIVAMTAMVMGYFTRRMRRRAAVREN